SLTLEPGDLVDDSQNRFFPDLRFRARLNGLPIRIDILFEHQSDVDRLMPVRFFCETGAIWARARREKRKAVPFVLNVVIYNGLRPWPSDHQLSDVIEGAEEIRQSAP